MATLDIAGGSLDYELTDLAAPWLTTVETVVFHHGVGATKGIWAEWLPALVDRYRVLRFDMRGHGRSTWPERDPTITLDELTDDLFAVMDAAGVSRGHLVGKSIGGTIVLNAALSRPDRVASLTISNGAHVGASIQSVQDWREVIAARGMAGWSAHMMPRRFFDDAVSPAQRSWFEAEQARAHPVAVQELLAALVGADLKDRLASLTAPTLLLHPDSSPFIPVAVMADLKERVPGSTLNVIGRARHGMPVSHARFCAGLLRDFLDLQQGAAA